jgi:hypothetical protein
MDIEQRIRRPPSLLSMIVWVLFCFVMWSWAIMGPIIVLLGLLTLHDDVPFVHVDLGSTTEERLKNIGAVAMLGAVGIAFVSLRLLGHLQFGQRD